MRVKEESTKVGLKLNIKKTKVMASGPITSWQIDEKEMESVQILLDLEYLLLSCGHCSSFSVICEFDQQTVHPFFHVINEKIKQDWPQDRALGDLACHWLPSHERCRYTLRGHKDSVNSIEFLPFSNIILTSSADKTLSLWDARTVSKIIVRL
ncbi:Sperm-associated antigen 16 protein [Varanus komodoensis]|nr:Sperm-associated antigen 16 protein [Varanus komodoensis]